MDQESIVYGCIKDIASTVQISERIRANREAMLSLPHADEWPFLRSNGVRSNGVSLD